MRKRNPGLSATKRKLRSEKIELESYLVQLRCGRLHTNRKCTLQSKRKEMKLIQKESLHYNIRTCCQTREDIPLRSAFRFSIVN